MFETAEVGNVLDKEIYSREAGEIRAALLQAQIRLASAGFSVVILLGGNEGAGKGEILNHLLDWLDARGIQTFAVSSPTEEERQRPPFWRFWMALPPAGRISLLHGSWYTDAVIPFLNGKIDQPAFDQRLDRILDFERMLTHENVLLLKFWLHLSRPAMKDRLNKLSREKNQRWRVTKRDWKALENYDAIRSAAGHALRRTSTGEAPWHLIEAADWRYRNLTVSKTLLHLLQARLQAAPSSPSPEPALIVPKSNGETILSTLQRLQALPEAEYQNKLLKFQGRINRYTRKLWQRKRSMILVFEGPDAAGKGGIVRRLTAAMDARDYQVMSVAAPTDEERSHPYLWRFWRHLPRLGRVSIYDRSWYGRVLVERIERFCSPSDWQRAYAEINAFEEQLADFGIIVLKFWLAISPDEQYRRFKDREITPYKQYKLTEEDWRNRAKWDAYESAACDMIERTSTEAAPWVVVEADCKEFARIKVLRTVARKLREVLAK